MDIKTKAQLDVLMEQFMWLQTDDDSKAFEPKWRTFFTSLNKADAEIAVNAWFAAIFENLAEIKKLIVVEEISDEEKTELAHLFEELRNHAFFKKPSHRE